MILECANGWLCQFREIEQTFYNYYLGFILICKLKFYEYFRVVVWIVKCYSTS